MADASDISLSVGLDIEQATKAATKLSDSLGAIMSPAQKTMNKQLTVLGKLQDQLYNTTDELDTMRTRYESLSKIIASKGIMTPQSVINDFDAVSERLAELTSQSDILREKANLAERGLLSFFRQSVKGSHANEMYMFLPLINQLAEIPQYTEEATRAIETLVSGAEASAGKELGLADTMDVSSVQQSFDSLKKMFAQTSIDSKRLLFDWENLKIACISLGSAMSNLAISNPLKRFAESNRLAFAEVLEDLRYFGLALADDLLDIVKLFAMPWKYASDSSKEQFGNMVQLFKDFAQDMKTYAKLIYPTIVKTFAKPFPEVTANRNTRRHGAGIQNVDLTPMNEILQKSNALSMIVNRIDLGVQEITPTILALSDSIKSVIDQVKSNASVLLNGLKQKLSVVPSIFATLFEGVKKTLSVVGQEFGRIGKVAINSFNVATKVAKVLTSSLRVVLDVAKNVVTILGNVGKKLLNIVGTPIKQGLSFIAKTVKGKLVTAFKKLNKTTNSGAGLLKKFILAGLGVRSIYFLFRKFWNYLKDGVKIIALLDSETNKSMSDIATASNGLRTQLGSISSEVVNAFAPIITELINGITLVMDKLSQLFAVMRGQSVYKKAIAVQQDYAESLRGSASAAKQLDLYSFDTLSRASSESSGGSGSGIDENSGKIETTEISDFIKQLRDFWSSGEFDKIGETLANKCNEWVNIFKDTLSWKNIGPIVEPVVTGITTVFNSFTEAFDWTSLGNIIGNGLNTALQTTFLIVDNIDWSQLGSKLGLGINGILETFDFSTLGTYLAEKLLILPSMLVGAIQSIDWTLVANAISETFINFFSTMSEWLSSVDWQSMGEIIATFISEIDWSNMATSLFTAIGEAIGGIGAFLVGLFKEAFTNFVSTYCTDDNGDLLAVGNGLISGILNGIVQVLADIGTWIYENIFTPLVEGFKTTFDIHSPSKNKEILAIGSNIFRGILNGILLVVNTVGTWIKLNVIDKVVKAFDFGSKMLDVGRNLIYGLWNGINDAFGWLCDRIKGFCDSVTDRLKDFFGIHSPSKVMEKEVGLFLGQGVGVGLEKSLPDAFSDASKIIDSQMSQLQAAIEIPMPSISTGKIVPSSATASSSISNTLNASTTRIESLLEELTKKETQLQAIIEFTGSLSQLGRVLEPVIRTEQNRRGSTIVTGGI